MDFKSYLSRFKNKIENVEKLFEKKSLDLSYDKLHSEKKVNHELLYFKNNKTEEKGIFVFGFDFFIKELEEQEFKKSITYDSLNFKIYGAYHELEKTQKKIKISDILNKIQDKRKDSYELDKILKRILRLAYYLNWKLERDTKDIEGDFIVETPNKFLSRLKQRFDLSVMSPIYEDDDLFLFLNAKGRLNLVFKSLNEFSKKEIENNLDKVLKKVFNIEKINYLN